MNYYIYTKDNFISELIKTSFECEVENDFIKIYTEDELIFLDFLDNLSLDYTLDIKILSSRYDNLDYLIIKEVISYNKNSFDDSDYLYHCLVYNDKHLHLNILIIRLLELHCDLYHTLRIYINNNGNTMKSAKELYIHRNILIYKTNKLESLLGIKLNKSKSIYLLNHIMYLLKI